MLYLARAYYEQRNLTEARRVLQRALHLVPHDQQILYNLALAEKEHALQTLQSERPAFVAVDRAVKYLEHATRTFRFLSNPASSRPRYDPSKAGVHLRECVAELATATKKLEAGMSTMVYAACLPDLLQSASRST